MKKAAKAKSASPQVTRRRSATTAAARHRINALLWDFYGEFPLNTSKWATLAFREPGERAGR